MKLLSKIFAILVVLALGSATAQAAVVGPLPYTLTNGTVADASQVMANFNKIVNDVNNNVIFPSFSQQNYYAADTGAANALVVSVSPVPNIYAAGMVINVKVAANNSGSTTINVNGLGVQSIVNLDGSSLKSRQLLTNMVAQIVYTGSNFQLTSLSPLAVRQVAVSRTTVLNTTPGGYSFTVPAGVYFVKVTGWGGGGGGGTTNQATSAGSGGGGGAWGYINLTVTPGDIISGNIGVSGVGGTPSSNGTAGGNTTVNLNGSLQGTLNGGNFGLYTSVANTLAVGVTGGSATGSWAVSMSGQNGASALSGYNGVGYFPYGGPGGDAPQGGAGGTGGYNGVGSGGIFPGGGGGGGAAGASNGGAGGPGWLVIEY